MKILVTGAAGYIGSNLCNSLLADSGNTVFGVDCFTDYYTESLKRDSAKKLEQSGVVMHELDLARDDLTPAMLGVDTIVHLAAQPGISHMTSWEDYHHNNILATHRLVEASRASECLRKFVNIGSSSSYGLHATDTEVVAAKPASWYGSTKLAAEQEVMATQRGEGFPACSLRLFSVYGPRERPDKLFPKLMRAIANDLEFPLFDGSWDHQRSFTYVQDICDGIGSVLENWEHSVGEIFNVGTDRCFTTGDAIEAVQEIMGKKAIIKNIPARLGDQSATHANIDKINTKIGWEPKTSLKEGLKRMVEWYSSEIHGKIDWV